MHLIPQHVRLSWRNRFERMAETAANAVGSQWAFLLTREVILNGHAIGIILKELVRRAIKTIRAEREVFEVKQKAGYGGDMTDVFTTADSKAQTIYVRSLNECFPGFGIIAEEGSLSEARFDTT